MVGSCQGTKKLKAKNRLQLIGINYHDTLHDAAHWLEKGGDPYIFTLFDKDGRLGMDFGVYGTPETFIVDQKGVIQYRHVGIITEAIWEHKLVPIIEGIKRGKSAY